jgi:hypothetical protein
MVGTTLKIDVTVLKCFCNKLILYNFSGFRLNHLCICRQLFKKYSPCNGTLPGPQQSVTRPYTEPHYHHIYLISILIWYHLLHKFTHYHHIYLSSILLGYHLLHKFTHSHHIYLSSILLGYHLLHHFTQYHHTYLISILLW